jgi:hypothetical protein
MQIGEYGREQSMLGSTTMIRGVFALSSWMTASICENTATS